MRSSFLINRKPTEIQIYRAKSLFKQIERTIVTIETLVRKLKFSGSKSEIKRGMEGETIHLIIIYESLKEMIRNSKDLEERFTFDMVKMKREIERILERYSTSSDDLSKNDRD